VRPHLPSLLRGARADRGPLLLAAVVVAVATVLAAAVPAALGRTADQAVADAVTRAGPDGAVVVDAPFEPEDPGRRVRRPRSAAIVADSASLAEFRLSLDLDAALRPPVVSVVSTALRLTDAGPNRTVRLAYVAGGAGPRVTWTAGRPPAASVPAAEADTDVPTESGPWPVQVGLSEQTAAALRLGPGDRVPARDPRGGDLDLRVSGVFRALDPADPSWLPAPLLQPVGQGGPLAVAALLSADSLPDGRLALDEGDVAARVTFTPEPSRLRWQDTETLAAAVVALKASSTATGLAWHSQLDTVLRTARAQVDAASAQASVLLAALVLVSVLVLLLAADLLVRRRTAVLATARARGASLPGLGAGLAVESIAVALAGAAAGLLVARDAGLWPLPVVLVAALAPPVLGVRAAARSTPRAVPANRSARRSAARTRQLRRLALEAAVVALAAGAFAALRQRGVAPGGDVLLPALAPTLGAVVGGLALLRLLPLAAELALRRAIRSRRSLPLLGAARAAATAARPLPFLVLVTSSALCTFALAVAATERRAPAAARDAPLAAGLLRLADASAVVLLLLGLLGVALGAAASAPDRGATMARLRTLGLLPREARLVAAGEVVPPVLVGAVGGLALGVLLAYASIGPLGLRRLTGPATDPGPAVPWPAAVLVALLVLAAAVVVLTESARSRRERLGQVLRA
jgi:hypothetical protein